MTIVKTTDFADLILVHRGKVRDMYALPGFDDLLLMVATDRISAYDVVMDDVIPGKGEILTRLSLFWFELLADIVDNHLITADVDDYPAVCRPYADELRGRSMLVWKTRPLPIECIVRGYISGSFWSAYKQDTTVCGFVLPPGMRESDKFAEPLFTPSTKAELGTHDENISLAAMEKIVGADRAREIATISTRLYQRAADYALQKGIIIADTKFELGVKDDKLILIDEVLTPDSSRFWPLDRYAPGQGQPSYDKQFLRDYLSSLTWDKTPPPPPLPAEIVDKTRSRYLEALQRITGE
ncbi:phosphoribosylaminoimidazolesuccinocarboxamide synthase [Desulfoprunum benzoelyticum]|uniref:Phosphoribosylaminoimidazole-succinocarboxamide synthase n=1 Tax=Desulfoprunum benzoelyticum TaxID=1506996 RepID=A0A840V0E9_9BACT|nr:phosphoribosylaminoimidazolesuccinocarboxamide synthase [Desulfoprunum benzoelyticum]MBB5346691.1 phosphoribosylaminoimidazole-succinocarboxamide synthase [Desulfoprunum benzoelyticum]MBM9529065.1 phosphoribosylaminoimidazolesuccinocarboxamide synthase [Desulfoprunum benzoelyticum]